MSPESTKPTKVITIYHNPRCRKSREALALLSESGEPYQVVEYLKNPLSPRQLEALLDKLSIPPMDLVRRNEAEWKEHFKGKQLSDPDIVQAMARFPKLMERPVAVKENRAIIGRPPEQIRVLWEGI